MDIYFFVVAITGWIPRKRDNALRIVRLLFVIEDESAELDRLPFLCIRRSGGVLERGVRREHGYASILNRVKAIKTPSVKLAQDVGGGQRK